MDDYLSKPVDRKLLQQTMLKWMMTPQRNAAAARWKKPR